MPQIPKVPTQEIISDFLDTHGIQLFIKREDLIHPTISGNKWRKLKYNIAAALQTEHRSILTFGGAYSNHIAAVAFAGKEFGLKTIGIIRGEKPSSLSYTLQDATACGMDLQFISRESYKHKTDDAFIEVLHTQHGNFQLIPEGGANALGVRGCAEIIDDINIHFNVVCCACGTGTSLAGIINGLNGKAHAIGFSALKAENYFEQEIKPFLNKGYSNWEINYNYHFGAYAKCPDSLKSFIYEFYSQTDIPLDGVYTGKMIFGIYDLIEKQHFQKGTTIVAIHTGGLQGNKGLGIELK